MGDMLALVSELAQPWSVIMTATLLMVARMAGITYRLTMRRFHHCRLPEVAHRLRLDIDPAAVLRVAAAVAAVVDPNRRKM
jgi:hypothetical protein